MNPPSESRWQRSDGLRGDEYDEKWRRMQAAGIDPHGEVAFVQQYAPATVLDAGCGTGRVAIELARRGVSVVGFDLDPLMLEAARRNAPELQWFEADAASVSLEQRFDVVVMAGNVMIFVAPGTEPLVVATMAAHVADGGRWITGFSLRPGGYDLESMDQQAKDAGLVLESRFATWDRDPFVAGADYAVSVYQHG